MQIETTPDIHLSYCSNIHPAESWSDTFRQLKKHIPELRRRLAHDQKFGIGLRLSNEAAETCLEQDHLRNFKQWLNQENLYVFTINGFPFGNFHHSRVKDDVYKPDWQTDERFKYTSNLIDILAELTSEGEEGSISTSPVSYKFWDQIRYSKDTVLKIAAENLANLAWRMAEIRKHQNKWIHLDIEPEPDCLIENTRETVDFFENVLIPVGGQLLSDNYGISMEMARSILLNHICVCYDTCHFALQYEDAEYTLQAFEKAGIRIGKVQISAAFRIPFEDKDRRDHLEKALTQFIEPVYLHQVIERNADGSLHQYRDLPEALPNINNPSAEEWRIHFHVPVFVSRFGDLQSTQDQTRDSLKKILKQQQCRHFEVETYTWDVLPPELKSDITESIERELRWAIEKIETVFE